MFSFIFLRLSVFFPPTFLLWHLPFSSFLWGSWWVGQSFLRRSPRPRGALEHRRASMRKACPPGWTEEAQGPQKSPGAG